MFQLINEDYNKLVTLKYLLEKQSVERGDAIYLQSANTDEEVTFKDVYSISNQVGHMLNHFKISKGDMIVTMIPNSFEAVYAWYGCAMIGAVEVPINCNYKGNMLSYVINHSEANLLIIHESLVDAFIDIQDQLEYLEKVIIVHSNTTSGLINHIKYDTYFWSDLLIKFERRQHEVEVFYYDVNHMLYTSGTTGPSKGVLCTYLQTYETGITTVREHATTSADCFYNPYPVNHIGARSSLYAMLKYGGRVVIRDQFKTDTFWVDVEKFKCTCTLLLGATANFLYKQPRKSDDANNYIKWVQMVPLIHDIEDFKARYNIEVQTCYNMTEVSTPIISDGFNLKDNESCGVIRDGFEVRLVDENDEEVAYGEVGEMVVRSNEPWTLMAGYWKEPEKTAEAWRNQWLHTGDLFYRDDEGNFYYVDRIKDSIRRRGENISSSEVEKEVNKYDKVLESAAVGVPSEFGEEEIKINVVPQPNTVIDPQELIKFLKPRMPRFMIPRYIEILDSLPKTETQKIKKVELKERGITEKTWDYQAIKSEKSN